ncbi:MAG TPA: hypothetical protein PLI27_09465 [Ignavibacteriales bacterium]|nr:hypothetical protein [Ignavibacteriales bacterium]HPD68287.1 hypothetical protein [Ignavibacteriales bacterium]HRR18477.1 hypothetical protein [Ignavibacteriales bacterium]
MKFNQIKNQLIPKIWDIASSIYKSFSNYLKNNLTSILISYNYDYSKNSINGDAFINDLDMNIQPIPRSISKKEFFNHFTGIWVGINLNPNRYYKASFYYWVQLSPAYNKFYFDDLEEAKNFKQILYKRGWEFIYVENYWIIVKYYPVERLNTTNNEWIHQLDEFFAKCCSEADELIFNVKQWGL